MNQLMVDLLLEISRLCIKSHNKRATVSLHRINSKGCTIAIKTPEIYPYALVPAQFFTLLQKTFPGIEFWIMPASSENTTRVEIDFQAESKHMSEIHTDLQKQINKEIKKLRERI